MIDPIKRRISNEELLYEMNTKTYKKRGTLVEVHISDIHFGVINPELQYKILEEQFLNKICDLKFDVLSIDGDLFDHKFMTNSDPVMYANLFVNKCVEICKKINATFVLLAGTYYHDANQLKSFSYYLEDPTIDFRLVEKVKFEYIKGAKILCIPELYNMGEEYYNKFLFNSGFYDEVFMHGTIEGAVFGSENNTQGTNSQSSPIFKMDDFRLCEGFIVSGHVHPGGCYHKYFYYCGSPIRSSFGDEGEKGFLIILHNLDTQEHYVYLDSIKSFRYDTIDASKLIQDDPKNAIEYLNKLQNNGIDNIRLDLNRLLNEDEERNLNIIKTYYRNNNRIKFKYEKKRIEQDNEALKSLDEEYIKYKYLLNKDIDPYTKFTMYVNQEEGKQFITVEELKSILEEIS